MALSGSLFRRQLPHNIMEGLTDEPVHIATDNWVPLYGPPVCPPASGEIEGQPNFYWSVKDEDDMSDASSIQTVPSEGEARRWPCKPCTLDTDAWMDNPKYRTTPYHGQGYQYNTRRAPVDWLIDATSPPIDDRRAKKYPGVSLPSGPSFGDQWTDGSLWRRQLCRSQVTMLEIDGRPVEGPIPKTIAWPHEEDWDMDPGEQWGVSWRPMPKLYKYENMIFDLWNKVPHPMHSGLGWNEYRFVIDQGRDLWIHVGKDNRATLEYCGTTISFCTSRTMVAVVPTALLPFELQAGQDGVPCANFEVRVGEDETLQVLRQDRWEQEFDYRGLGHAFSKWVVINSIPRDGVYEVQSRSEFPSGCMVVVRHGSLCMQRKKVSHHPSRRCHRPIDALTMAW